MKILFLFSTAFIILVNSSFSQTKSKEEIESWILSKLNAFIPKNVESEFKNKDGETIEETVKDQRFYFENGNLILYVYVYRQKKEEYFESASYKVKNFFPICYYDRVEENTYPVFTIWTNKTSSIKKLRYDRTVMTSCSKCEKGYYTGSADDETEFFKGLKITYVTSWETNLLDRLHKAFTDLKQYYPEPNEAY